jgi:cytochrome c-type biogenesis protein CcmH/NrfG
MKREKAWWYLGNSYFQLDMRHKAKEAMQKAYHLKGAYSRVAKSYLDAMAQVNTGQPSSK